MAYKGEATLNTNGEDRLGTFSSYLRRPATSQLGMTAMFFGPDGQESDLISSLSLSKYQDVEVFVSVYMIKDTDGKSMRQDGGVYPKITSFLAYIRRPTNGKHNGESGLIANFYAPNGSGADAMAALCISQFVDSLVFVDIRTARANTNEFIDDENNTAIEENYSNIITSKEAKLIIKEDKKYKKINEVLFKSEFLTYSKVVEKLCSNPTQFQDWLSRTQTCCAPSEDPCLNDSAGFKINSFLQEPFNYLPLCAEHFEQLKSVEYLQLNAKYFEMKHKILLKQWAISLIKSTFTEVNHTEPNPLLILNYFSNHKLLSLMDEKFTKLASSLE